MPPSFAARILIGVTESDRRAGGSGGTGGSGVAGRGIENRARYQQGRRPVSALEAVLAPYSLSVDNTRTERMDEGACGFMPGRSTTDQIFTLRNILQHRMERGEDSYVLFVDFAKAYDSIHRPSLYATLASDPIATPKKLLDLIILAQEGSSCAVKFQNFLSQFFDVASGVKQGDPIAPMLFNIALQGAAGELHQEQLHPELLEQPVFLAFADDIAIIASKKEELVEKCSALERNAARFGLRISAKTEFMAVSRNPRDPAHGDHLQVGETTYRRVADFKYLGSTINELNNIDVEVRARTLAGLRSYYSLARAFKSNKLSRAAKGKLYTTVVRPAITYATETLTLTAARETRFTVAENNILRRVAGPVLNERRQRFEWRDNAAVRDITKVSPIANRIKESQFRYVGHVARGSAPANAGAVLNMSPIRKGSRPAGGIRTRYMDQVRRDAARVLPPNTTIEDCARDREAYSIRKKLFYTLPCPHEERRRQRKERFDQRLAEAAQAELALRELEDEEEEL